MSPISIKQFLLTLSVSASILLPVDYIGNHILLFVSLGHNFVLQVVAIILYSYLAFGLGVNHIQALGQLFLIKDYLLLKILILSLLQLVLSVTCSGR